MIFIDVHSPNRRNIAKQKQQWSLLFVTFFPKNILWQKLVSKFLFHLISTWGSPSICWWYRIDTPASTRGCSWIELGFKTSGNNIFPYIPKIFPNKPLIPAPACQRRFSWSLGHLLGILKENKELNGTMVLPTFGHTWDTQDTPVDCCYHLSLLVPRWCGYEAYLAFEGKKIIRTARRSVTGQVVRAWMLLVPTILLGIGCGWLFAKFGDSEWNLNLYLVTGRKFKEGTCFGLFWHCSDCLFLPFYSIYITNFPSPNCCNITNINVVFVVAKFPKPKGDRGFFIVLGDGEFQRPLVFAGQSSGRLINGLVGYCLATPWCLDPVARLCGTRGDPGR